MSKVFWQLPVAPTPEEQARNPWTKEGVQE